jgi:hypothetical protein
MSLSLSAVTGNIFGQLLAFLIAQIGKCTCKPRTNNQKCVIHLSYLLQCNAFELQGELSLGTKVCKARSVFPTYRSLICLRPIDYVAHGVAQVYILYPHPHSYVWQRIPMLSVYGDH